MVLSNKHVHQATIEKALTEYDDVDDKIIIYSGNYKNLVSKRILIMFSPVMKSLIASSYVALQLRLSFLIFLLQWFSI